MPAGLIRTVIGFGGEGALVKLGSSVYDGIQLGRAMSHTSGRWGKRGVGGGVSAEAFDFALDECVTAGQVALIMEIGINGFEEAVIAGLENGRDATGTLLDMTDHPEAIGDILEAAEQKITDAYKLGANMVI
jgi:hypothetical protein